MNSGGDPGNLMAGLPDPVLDSQSIFRSTLRAMSYPGRRQSVGIDVPAPAPLDRATVAVCMTLLDVETPVWLDPRSDTVAVADHLRFHCGAPLVREPGAACFAVVTEPAEMPRLTAFDAGNDQYPDRSATLLIQLASLDRGPAVRLTGPGVEDQCVLFADGLPGWFWEDWAANGLLFPTGIDVILSCGSDIVGLPRSIKGEI